MLNLKRRIYDAINVMEAVQLISRTKSSQLYIDKPENSDEGVRAGTILVRKNLAAVSSEECIKNYGRELEKITERVGMKK